MKVITASHSGVYRIYNHDWYDNKVLGDSGHVFTLESAVSFNIISISDTGFTFRGVDGCSPASIVYFVAK